MTASTFYACLLVGLAIALLTDCGYTCPRGCQCVSDAPYLTSCIDLNMTEIPSDIPSNTVELYLKGNRIKTISEGAFRDLTSLRNLVFTRNQLEVIEPNAFVGLADLVNLDLRGNRLNSLPSHGFSGLSSLKKLELDNNDIQNISQMAFSDLNLTKLGLENNPKLVHIDPEAFQDSAVFNLFIFGTNLSARSAEAFRNLRGSLRELFWMDNQQPVVLPFDLFEGFKFTNLNLDNNGIKDVSFLKYVSVDDLSLVGNPIGPVDFSRFQSLSNVRFLHLDRTNLAYVDPTFFRSLRQLETLHIPDNGITTLPEGLKPLFSQLKNLKLDGNPLHCNCELIWLKKFLSSPDLKTDIAGVQCSTPSEDDIANVDEESMQCSAPRVINVTKTVTVQAGSQLTITCFAEGDPSPQILWELPDGTPRRHSPSHNRTQTVVRRDFQKVAAMSDAGQYKCMAINMQGNDSAVAVVKVLPGSSSTSFSSAPYVSLFCNHVVIFAVFSCIMFFVFSRHD